MLFCLILDRKIQTLHVGQTSHATSRHRKSAKSLQKKKTLSPCTCRISMRTTLDAGESPWAPCGLPSVVLSEQRENTVRIGSSLPPFACVRATAPLSVSESSQGLLAILPSSLIFSPLQNRGRSFSHTPTLLKCWRVWLMMAALCCLPH